MVRAIMHGCNGKMGRAITALAKEDAEVEIVAGVDAYTEISNEYPVFESIEKCDVEADVVIDFSNAKAVDGLLDYCVEKQIPVVLCTTGLSEEQLQEVEEASAKVAVLRSANMSLGVNTLLEMVKTAARILGEAGFDIDIVEKHHRRKLDAPSGTALTLASTINDALGNEMYYEYNRHDKREKRNPKEIGIHSIRGGNVVGKHTVMFFSETESFEITHNAQSRGVFADGAIRAAEYLVVQENGLYNMNNIFNS